MKPATNSLSKKKHAIPHVYIILLSIILLATVLTYIVPAGQFDRETVDNVKMVIPGTYHRIDQTPVNLFDMFVAIPQGFVSMANIVILIYMCVAGMGILTSTGALERVFGSFISKVGAKGRVVMLILADQGGGPFSETSVQAFGKTAQCIEKALNSFSSRGR